MAIPKIGMNPMAAETEKFLPGDKEGKDHVAALTVPAVLYGEAAVARVTLDRPAPRARCLPRSVALPCLEDPAPPSAQPASPRGNTTSTVVPSSFVDRTRISPRCAITICCEM